MNSVANLTNKALLPIVMASAVILATLGSSALAQTAARPAFAVAAIKPSGSDTGRSIRFLPGGRFVATGANVRLLIKVAYNLNDDQVSGGPAWIGTKHFDIDAKPDAATADAATATDAANAAKTPMQDLTHLRLQALLEDRFHLKLRSEMKEMKTYALVVAKNGPKLTKAANPATPVHFQGSTGTIFATSASMDQLAGAMSDWVGHPVVNLTGLDGRYDLRLTWTPDQAAPQAQDASGATPPPPADTGGPTIFTALQQQLGLSLQSRKSKALFETVENVELPTEN